MQEGEGRNLRGSTHYKDLCSDASSSPRELGQVEVTLCYNDNLQRLTLILGTTRGIKASLRDTRGIKASLRGIEYGGNKSGGNEKYTTI